MLNKVSTFLFERISQAIQQIEQAPEPYRHQLIIVVAPTKQRQTILLSELADQLGLRYVNVNLELSRLLLDVPKK